MGIVVALTEHELEETMRSLTALFAQMVSEKPENAGSANSGWNWCRREVAIHYWRQSAATVLRYYASQRRRSSRTIRHRGWS